MKKNITQFSFTILVIGLVAFAIYNTSKKNDSPQEKTAKTPITINAKPIRELHSYSYTATYPATIVGQNQATISTLAGGTIQSLNFDLGKQVYQGQRLAKIDNTGGFSAPGKFGLENGQIRSMELAVENAEDAYKQAKRIYKKDNSYNNKKSKAIAKNNWLSAEAGLQSALDSQYVSAPISGTIVKKMVSIGDSVAPGQTLAIISKTDKVKLEFYVSKDELAFLKKEQPVSIIIDQQKIDGKISLIAPEADTMTKRFLVEALPKDNLLLPIGSLASVELNIEHVASESNRYIVPISIITIGQNENTIFTVVEEKAKKIPIVIHQINGETAEISSEKLAPSTQVILEGNKLVQEGDPITITN